MKGDPSKATIYVTPVPNGPVATWEVWCRACRLTTRPARRKSVAEAIANQHAKDVHKWDAVVAVKKA